MEKLNRLVRTFDEIRSWNPGSLTELYRSLRDKASEVIDQILIEDPVLKNTLLRLATIYTQETEINGIKFTDDRHAWQAPIVLAHTFFEIHPGSASLCCYLDLDPDHYTVYSLIEYSADYMHADYCEELSGIYGTRHTTLGIPDKILFRHLPIIDVLTNAESARLILEKIVSEHTGPSLLDFEWIDLRTGEIIPNDDEGEETTSLVL